MARWIELHPTVPQLKRSVDGDRNLEAYLQWELEMAFSDRHAQEREWIEARRQYAAIPAQPYRNAPVPNAPNIEVPLGAIAADALYAQMTTVLYSGEPLLTARALNEDHIEAAKAAQRWVNYVAAQEVQLRLATDHAFSDCVQMGTSAYYVPYTRDEYTTAVNKVTKEGPKILPIAPENIVFLGGSRGRLQDDRWVAIRWWYSPGEMRARAKAMGWDMSQTLTCASLDWVRRQTEAVGKTNSSSAWKEQYEIIEWFVYYDYNGDGVDMDLHVYYDRSSQRVLSVELNEYDERPIVPMIYQVRPNLAYGLGVMSMMRPFQWEATEVHNSRILNMFIANCRHWIAQEGAVPENLEIFPNKVTYARDINAVKELKMGDEYPSASAAEEIVDALAARRVGTDGTLGTGSAAPHAIGTRTPGITAMSTMQAQNARFTPAFDSMRLATCEALRQCLLRQRERLLMGGKDAETMAQHMLDVLGEDDAKLVVDLLKEPDFDRYVAVEFTAISPQTNAAADQQAITQLWQTAVQMYYTPQFQLLQAVAQPGVPPEVVEAAMQISQKSTELFDRYLRTYDQTRDPKAFLLEMQQAFEGIQQGAAQAAQTGAQVHGAVQSLFGGQNGQQPGTPPQSP